MSDYIGVKEISESLGVKLDVVYLWLNSGELRGVNVAERRTTRPRWRVSREALDAFLEGRSSRPPVKATRRKRPKMEVIEFFK